MASQTDVPPSAQDAVERPIRERHDEVKARIAAAAQKSGRKASEVVLVAVTKTASMDQIREVIGLGQVDLGENRVQQLQQRVAQVDEYLARRSHMPSASASKLPQQVRWHMIGTLQRNKIKKAIELVRLVHSVDNLRLAEDLQLAAEKRDKPVEVLIEVNVAEETSKHGIAPAAARHLVDMIDTMLSLKPRGLMVMAPNTEDRGLLQRTFTRARELFDEIRRAGLGGDRFDILSMGMTNDYEVAIECGSNMVRIGSAIFGKPAIEEGGEDE
jgi:pyridoxal phosphate enzyme (YggS family)